MNTVVVSKNDDIVMRLAHYFITVENYTPIVVNGVKDEIWLENDNGPYKIIRISSGYIHNKEQYDFDIYKTHNIMKQIKKKAMFFKINTLNILLNINNDITIYDDKDINTVTINSLNDVKKKTLIVENFPSIKNNLLENIKGVDLILNVSEDINKKQEKENHQYEAVFKPKLEIITYILMTISITLFLITFLVGDGGAPLTKLLSNHNYLKIKEVISFIGSVFSHVGIYAETLFRFGANYHDAVKAGEVYRLVTSIFLHAGILHLLVNMYSLKVIGGQIETYLGKWRYLVVFLLSGITGSMLSIIFHDNLSVGASGALFGLLGSLLYFGSHYRVYLNSVIKTQIIPIIIMNLIIGFMTPGIDNAAHIGGLIGGYLFTMMVGIKNKSSKREIITGVIASILYVGILSYFIWIY